MWFFRSDYNTKISSLVGISGIAANINQEFLYLPMQKMPHVPTFNSICYFKGQSFKVMLPSYNISLKLGFKSIYRCSYIHTHLFTCTNKYKTFSLTNFDHFISFSIWFKATLKSRVHRSPTASPGISWRARAFSEALCQITWICKMLFAARVRNRSTVVSV